MEPRSPSMEFLINHSMWILCAKKLKERESLGYNCAYPWPFLMEFLINHGQEGHRWVAVPYQFLPLLQIFMHNVHVSEVWRKGEGEPGNEAKSIYPGQATCKNAVVHILIWFTVLWQRWHKVTKLLHSLQFETKWNGQYWQLGWTSQKEHCRILSKGTVSWYHKSCMLLFKKNIWNQPQNMTSCTCKYR